MTGWQRPYSRCFAFRINHHSKASYVIDLVLADMFCLNGCHPSKCLLVKLFPCWSGWTLLIQLKAPRESGDPSSIIIMLWSAKVSCYISQSCLSVTGHTNLPTHVKYAPMHGRTRGADREGRAPSNTNICLQIQWLTFLLIHSEMKVMVFQRHTQK